MTKITITNPAPSTKSFDSVNKLKFGSFGAHESIYNRFYRDSENKLYYLPNGYYAFALTEGNFMCISDSGTCMAFCGVVKNEHSIVWPIRAAEPGLKVTLESE